MMVARKRAGRARDPHPISYGFRRRSAERVIPNAPNLTSNLICKWLHAASMPVSRLTDRETIAMWRDAVEAFLRQAILGT